MRQALAVLLLFVSMFVQSACAAVNFKAQVHAAMFEINVSTPAGDGECTAYAVGPHALATAEHCFEGNPLPQLVKITFGDSDAVEPVEAILLDKDDHALVIFKAKTFTTWVTFVIGSLQQGDRVYFWGNPMAVYYATDCYREGYYSGRTIVNWKGVKTRWDIFNLTVAPGDSGSLIFNEDGAVVGMVSKSPAMGFTVSMEFRFTPEQIARASK